MSCVNSIRLSLLHTKLMDRDISGANQIGKNPELSRQSLNFLPSILNPYAAEG